MAEIDQEPYTCLAFPGLEFTFAGDRDTLRVQALYEPDGRRISLVEFSRNNHMRRLPGIPPDFPLLSGLDAGGKLTLQEKDGSGNPSLHWVRFQGNRRLPPVELALEPEGEYLYLHARANPTHNYSTLFNLSPRGIELSHIYTELPQIRIDPDTGFPVIRENSSFIGACMTASPVVLLKVMLGCFAALRPGIIWTSGNLEDLGVPPPNDGVIQWLYDAYQHLHKANTAANAKSVVPLDTETTTATVRKLAAAMTKHEHLAENILTDFFHSLARGIGAEWSISGEHASDDDVVEAISEDDLIEDEGDDF